MLCEHDGLQLVLQFTYGHVTPRPGLDQHWIETPRGRLGDLEVSDAWVSHDPQLPKKGNHVHLEVDGLYDKDFDTEMAHNLDLDGKPISDDMRDFLRRRAMLMNDCLLKRCTRRD